MHPAHEPRLGARRGARRVGWRLEALGTSQGEALGRRSIAQALVLSGRVVLGHPDVDGALGVLEGVEDLAAQALLLQGLVEPLDLARRRGRTRGGEQMADPVLRTDPVEQHGAVTRAEASGEDLAVVGEDGFGHTVGLHGAAQGVAHRLGRGSGDHLGAHAKARVVVDAGDNGWA